MSKVTCRNCGEEIELRLYALHKCPPERVRVCAICNKSKEMAINSNVCDDCVRDFNWNK